MLQRAFPMSLVREAGENAAAYDAMQQFKPDLIITDLHRPGETGLDLIDAVRDNPYTTDIPILLITAQPHPKWRDEAIAAGANSFLTMPFAPRDFLEEIKTLLDTSRDSDSILVELGYETRELDYKLSVDLQTSAGRAALAKDVIAFANWGGGNIVIGVDEVRPGDFFPTGIPDHDLPQYEVTRLNRSLRDYLDPPIPIEVRRVTWRRRRFVVLQVPRAEGGPVLAARKHDGAGLYMGRIYTRSAAAESAEVQHAAELRQLLSKLYFAATPANQEPSSQSLG